MEKSISKIVSGCILFLLLAPGCNPLAAQEVTASIRGVVLDPSGAGVPNAKITAIRDETGLTRTTVSDHQGSYVIVLLPVGHYRLEVSAKGFQTFVQEGISLGVNEAANVPI